MSETAEHSSDEPRREPTDAAMRDVEALIRGLTPQWEWEQRRTPRSRVWEVRE